MEITFDACLFQITKRKMLLTLEVTELSCYTIVFFLSHAAQYAAFIDSTENVQVALVISGRE